MQHTEELLEIVKQGGIVIYPTDTIRGVGCDATNEIAVEKVYEAKQRPKEKSMIVLVSSYEMLEQHSVMLSETQKNFLKQTQKPTTMVVNNMMGLAPNVYHSDGSLGVRIVESNAENKGAERCHAFIESFGKPIVSTSANLSGDPSPKSFEDINPELLQHVDGYLLPEIAQTIGEPSQIVRIDTTGEVTILRP